MKEYSVIKLTWVDANHYSDELTEDEIVGGATMETIGHLIKQDDKFYYVARDVNTSNNPHTFRGIQCVPFVNITEKKYME